MILVAGGTGNLGRRLVALLRADGIRVRVLTRDPARAARLADGVDVVSGDVRDPASLANAMDGVRTVVSAVHGFAGSGGVTPDSVDRTGNANLIAGAEAAGVERFVLVSIAGARADSPMELFRAKHDAETRLRSSRLAWTMIRPTAYVETWADIMAETLRRRGRILVFGEGTNPINFVSVDDVARLTALVIGDTAARGRSIDIGGPENVSFDGFAEALLAVTGGTGSVRHVPRPMLSLMLAITRVVKPDVARMIEASLVMDTQDMTFDTTAFRRGFPDVPLTDIDTALKNHVLGARPLPTRRPPR